MHSPELRLKADYNAGMEDLAKSAKQDVSLATSLIEMLQGSMGPDDNGVCVLKGTQKGVPCLHSIGVTM